jgi:hypothetical protein
MIGLGYEYQCRVTENFTSKEAASSGIGWTRVEKIIAT